MKNTILILFVLFASIAKAATPCVMVTYANDPYHVYNINIQDGDGVNCSYVVQCTGMGFKNCPTTNTLIEDWKSGCGIPIANTRTAWANLQIDFMANLAFNSLETGSTSGGQTTTFVNSGTSETIILNVVWSSQIVDGDNIKTYTVIEL